MILMQAPGPGMSFGPMPSGVSYTSDTYGQIKITNNSTADQAALAAIGCYTLSSFGSWGNFGFSLLSDLYTADAASNLVLTGVTGFPNHTIVTITNDGGNTGTWQKTGTGVGSGNWTQISTLTLASISALIQQAITGATNLSQAVAFGTRLAVNVAAFTTTALPSFVGTATTLTASSNGAFPTVDGQAISVGNCIGYGDVAASTASPYWGFYTLTNAGSVSTKWVLTRVSGLADTPNLVGGQYAYISGGSTLAGLTIQIPQTAATIVAGGGLGTANLTTVKMANAALTTIIQDAMTKYGFDASATVPNSGPLTLVQPDANRTRFRIFVPGSTGNVAVSFNGDAPVINGLGSYTIAAGSGYDFQDCGTNGILAISDQVAGLPVTADFYNTSAVNVNATAAANALIARFSSVPSAAWQTAIQKFIGQIYPTIWNQLDALFVTASFDSVSALLNWVGAGSAVSHGTLAFVKGSGFTGDGTTGYLDTGVVLGGGKFALANCGMGLAIGDTTLEGTTAIGMGNGQALIQPNRSSTAAGYRSNTAASDVVTVGGKGGVFAWDRTLSTAYTARWNAGFQSTISTPYSSVSGYNLLIGANNGGSGATAFSTDQLQVAWAGAGLTDSQYQTFYAAIQTFLTTVNGLA
jgi:hypothetical protein